MHDAWCRSCSSPRSGQPVAGVVFVLDGVLIGAGDGTYLAWAGLAALAVYAPAVLVAGALGGGLLAVWVTFAVVLMGARLVVLTCAHAATPGCGPGPRLRR